MIVKKNPINASAESFSYLLKYMKATDNSIAVTIAPVIGPKVIQVKIKNSTIQDRKTHEKRSTDAIRNPICSCGQCKYSSSFKTSQPAVNDVSSVGVFICCSPLAFVGFFKLNLRTYIMFMRIVKKSGTDSATKD